MVAGGFRQLADLVGEIECLSKVFELKFFFNSGISRVTGADVASESVKEKVKGIVSAENTSHPYSDQKIVELLLKENINIARRTVAKYREMLGILPSSKRKKVI